MSTQWLSQPKILLDRKFVCTTNTAFSAVKRFRPHEPLYLCFGLGTQCRQQKVVREGAVYPAQMAEWYGASVS